MDLHRSDEAEERHRAGLTRAEVLIVDDEPANVALLERTLGRHGYERVRALTDPREVVAAVRARPPDLLLLDLHMPHLSGFAVLAELEDVVRAEIPLPVLVLTADVTTDTKLRALAAGARDFLAKPFDLTEVLLRIGNLLETRLLQARLRDHNAELERRVRERTAEVEHARFEVLERLGLAAEYRDDNTHEHTARVGRAAGELAAALGARREEIETLALAAPLHDVGKIGIPDAILLKPGPLTPAEFRVMQTHTTIGAQILSGGAGRLLREAEAVARCHHERWDGTGYPAGLAGEAIPPSARIVAVVDVFDALLYARPHKPAWSLARALAEIRAGSGTHFEPEVADAFVALVEAGLADVVEPAGDAGRVLLSSPGGHPAGRP